MPMLSCFQTYCKLAQTAKHAFARSSSLVAVRLGLHLSGEGAVKVWVLKFEFALKARHRFAHRALGFRVPAS